jgi:putative flippase GtrA
MGGLSATSHVGATWVLVSAGLEPTVATSIGFAVSVVVSYVLQREWVFRSRQKHRETIPKFLLVVTLAGATNWFVVFIGTEAFEFYYLGPQIVALIIIPIQNFFLNSLFTFGNRHKANQVREIDVQSDPS